MWKKKSSRQNDYTFDCKSSSTLDVNPLSAFERHFITCKFWPILLNIFRDENIDLPNKGKYATGIVYTDKQNHQEGEKMFVELASQLNLQVFSFLIKV